MHAVTDCPDPDYLARLLTGRLSAGEVAGAEDHLASCTRCSSLLGTIDTADPLLDAARAAATEDVLEFQRKADDVVPWIKRMRHDPTATVAFADTAEATVDGPRPGGYEFLAPPQAADELGRLGPFVVRQTLGAGGMGVVFVADDPRLNRRVAIKVIRPDLLARPSVRERFFTEARAAARVEHEHIVGVYEADEVAGVPYLVMPLLRGESLEDYADRIGPLPIDEVLTLGRGIAAGLAAAHGQGLIHRDVKPANVFVTEAGVPKILDFGLARALGTSTDEPDEPGKIAGTPAYMSPEQATSAEVDARSDLFSLGCVLYRLATGKRPFRATNLVALLLQVVERPPEPPTRLRPELPADVEALILHLLEKDPARRPASARAVVEAIDAIRHRRNRRSRLPWILGAAAALAVAVGATYALTAGEKAVPEDPAEVTFAFDEPDARLVLRRGEDDETTIDVGKAGKMSLRPGTYTLRPAAKSSRELVPGVVTFGSGEKAAVEVRLVGEVSRDLDCPSLVRDVACAGKGDALVVLAAGGAARDANVRMWRPAQGGKDREGHADRVFAVALTPDGKRAATGGGGRGAKADTAIRLWDVEKGVIVAIMPTPGTTNVTSLAFSADGALLFSGDSRDTLTLWDVPGRKAIRSWTDHDRLGVHGVALSADGRRGLSAGGDGRVVLWDMKSGTKLKEHADHKGEVRTVAFAPDGRSAVSGGSDGSLIVWEIDAGKRRDAVAGHKGGVYRAAYSPDGGRILTGGADGVVRLWDGATGEMVRELKGHTNAVYGVAFSADGRRAVTGGAGRQLRLWELPR